MGKKIEKLDKDIGAKHTDDGVVLYLDIIKLAAKLDDVIDVLNEMNEEKEPSTDVEEWDWERSFNNKTQITRVDSFYDLGQRPSDMKVDWDKVKQFIKDNFIPKKR